MQLAITLRYSPRDTDIKQTQKHNQQCCLTEKARAEVWSWGTQPSSGAAGDNERTHAAQQMLASNMNSAPHTEYQTHLVSAVQLANAPELLILIMIESLICMCSPMIKNLEAEPIVTAPLLQDGRKRFIYR